jgi:hypothetical protein
MVAMVHGAPPPPPTPPSGQVSTDASGTEWQWVDGGRVWTRPVGMADKTVVTCAFSRGYPARWVRAVMQEPGPGVDATFRWELLVLPSHGGDHPLSGAASGRGRGGGGGKDSDEEGADDGAVGSEDVAVELDVAAGSREREGSDALPPPPRQPQQPPFRRGM